MLPGVLVACDKTGDCGVTVQGMVVAPEDVLHVLTALRRAPSGVGRHAPTADAARAHAGAAALQIRDTMVRARVMDAVDGWGAALGLPIETTAEGSLHEPAPDSGLRGRLLSVVCPTTGRRYVLRVPARMRTVRAARHWTLGLHPGDAPPEVES